MVDIAVLDACSMICTYLQKRNGGVYPSQRHALRSKDLLMSRTHFWKSSPFCRNDVKTMLMTNSSCADRLAPLIGTMAGLRPIHMPSELSQSSDSLAKQKITINWWEWSAVSFLLTKNISAKRRKKSCWQDSHGTLCLKCFRNAQLEVCHVALARCDSKSDPWLHALPGIQYAVRLNKLRKCFCSVFFGFFGNAVYVAPTVEILASFLTLAVHHDRKFQ